MSYPEDFLHICQDDFSGILRGKTLCHPTEKPIQDCKTGWIPSNALITFFGALTPLPEVEVGDLQFVPALEKPSPMVFKHPWSNQQWSFKGLTLKALQQLSLHFLH